jgi:hypothetical protein
MSLAIPPLTEAVGNGLIPGPLVYVVRCRECGDVTRLESNFTTEGPVPLQQAGLYRQRHLARHLTALATEVAEAAR